VVCSISGFGQSGPLRDKAGHDIGYLALSGVLSRSGLGDLPSAPGAQIADFFGGGLQAVIAVLAALLERARTGRGRVLDVALSEGTMQALLPRLIDASSEDVLRGDRPCYRIYGCRGGGAVALGALEPKFWQRFCVAVGHLEWDGRQLDPGLSATVDEMFLTRTRDEWVALLGPADCCLEPVLVLRELAALPHHQARSLWLADGRPRTLPALVETSALPARRAPAHGEHTLDVLRAAGVTDEDVAGLRTAGVVP
jgi:alpha-methylacyl-CoA racemase